ncbi:hypothetical protein EDD18DRAFT_1107716 [Armillaria luteobubalina]|uniref:Uncharacterized protein n=1 Tax=Armillaria luteobubalina TaxID=153913 RepID=A0AA39Q0W1_9AGAR|nr:hypothetical protein EDD18DRAFT_1107716 [Armillaria luteobubalina]
MSKNASIHTDTPITDGQQSNTEARPDASEDPQPTNAASANPPRTSYPSFILVPRYTIKYPFSKEELQELRNHCPDMEKYLLHDQFDDYVVPLFAKWERTYPTDPQDDLFAEEVIDTNKLR